MASGHRDSKVDICVNNLIKSNLPRLRSGKSAGVGEGADHKLPNNLIREEFNKKKSEKVWSFAKPGGGVSGSSEKTILLF